MSKPTPLLVLGLGNVLLQDDGVGATAVAMLLDAYEPPAGARVLDGGTLGLSLLPHVEDAETVILVDAVLTDAAAGALVRLDSGDVMPAVATRLSPHQVGVLDLLDGARWRDRFPQHVVLLGIVPGGFELSVELTPPVAMAVPALVKEIVHEAARFGFRFTPRSRGGQRPDDGAVGLGRLSATAASLVSRGRRPAPTASDAAENRA
jgi:hydrogenase maturation protease